MLSIDVNNKCIYCTDFSNETMFAFLAVDISIPPQGVMNDHAHAPCHSQFYQDTQLLSFVSYHSLSVACIVSEPVGDTKLEFDAESIVKDVDIKVVYQDGDVTDEVKNACLDFIHKNSCIFIRNMTVEIPTAEG